MERMEKQVVMEKEFEKEFVTYELALRMKQLGFDKPCIKFYWEDGMFLRGYEEPFNHNKYDTISAPLFQQAFRWFREKHKMVGTVQITVSVIDRENWLWEIYNLQGRKVDDGQELSDPYNTSCEEAELACLKKLIEIVKEKI